MLRMPLEKDTDRADRLLRKMHPVFSHDLPNQLVAIQGLLQLLEEEETLPPSSEGREYVGRLQRVAEKAASMVHFLKELGRLGGYQQRLEEVSLMSLMREIKVDLQQQIPDARFDCQFIGDVRPIRVDAKLLRLAVVEVMRCLAERGPARPCALRLTGRQTGLGQELAGEVTWGELPTAAPLRADSEPIHKRLEVVLAQELLTVWGAQLVEVREASQRSEFIMFVPQASAHG